MKDPRRLLEGDATPELHDLLSAGALEEPPADGRTRLLSALGVTPPVGTAAGPSQPPGPGGVGYSGGHMGGAGGGATAGAGAAATGGALGAAGAAKLALLALGGAALLATGALLWSQAGTDDGNDASDTGAAGHAGHTGGDAKLKANTPVPAGADGPTNPISLDHVAGGGKPTGALALEIEALERVRSQLAHGNGLAALATLKGYARSHPSGALAQEADVLRVEAHLLAGDAGTALQLAQRLLERHDDSPHRTRLQALVRQARARAHPEP